MATILVPGVLRGECDGMSKLEIEPVATLGEVFDVVARRWPRLHRRIRDEQGQIRRYVNVYVDGEDCRRLDGLGTSVRESAEIQVLPSVAGG
jgi:molybdopterin synthase sulfur carrier subunit